MKKAPLFLLLASSLFMFPSCRYRGNLYYTDSGHSFAPTVSHDYSSYIRPLAGRTFDCNNNDISYRITFHDNSFNSFTLSITNGQEEEVYTGTCTPNEVTHTITINITESMISGKSNEVNVTYSGTYDRNSITLDMGEDVGNLTFNEVE